MLESENKNEGRKAMKKAVKFDDWCYKTLSDGEVKMLAELDKQEQEVENNDQNRNRK